MRSASISVHHNFVVVTSSGIEPKCVANVDWQAWKRATRASMETSRSLPSHGRDHTNTAIHDIFADCIPLRDHTKIPELCFCKFVPSFVITDLKLSPDRRWETPSGTRGRTNSSSDARTFTCFYRVRWSQATSQWEQPYLVRPYCAP